MRFLDVIIFLLIIVVIGCFLMEFGRVQTKIETLQTEIVDLKMHIGTTKLLLLETQKLVVPDERALKRRIK